MGRPKSRGNGQGSAYLRGRTWEAQVVIGWKIPEDPSAPPIAIKRRKGGFATKKEAINYCSVLLAGPDTSPPERLSLDQVYKQWEKYYTPRVGESTMGNYLYAYKHFSKLHGVYMDLIKPEDLQACMDACPSGHRTHQNMKTVAGLLWAYAIDKNIIRKDITDNLYIGRGHSVQREALTPADVEKIRQAIPLYRYADYIYCLCYLGFRPGEFLELKKSMLHCDVLENEETGEKAEAWFFINGKKTDAGRDRIVVVPSQILPIILSRLYVPGTDLVFPQYFFTRGKKVKLRCFKQMTDSYFRTEVFKPMLKKLSIPGDKVPYSARHTYADKLKKASGSDRDKAALIGHSNYLFTQKKYQSSDLGDLKNLVDSIV